MALVACSVLRKIINSHIAHTGIINQNKKKKQKNYKQKN